MFNRRFLRIKVMQSLYSKAIAPDSSLLGLQKNLQNGLRDSWRAFLLQLVVIEQMARQVEAFRLRQENRHRQDLEIKLVPLSLPNNPFILSIDDSEAFKQMLTEFNLHGFFPDDLLFNLFQALKKKEFFWKYNEDNIEDSDIHRRTINSLYKKVILKNDDFSSFLEEEFVNWTDDAQLIILTVNKMVRNFFEKEEPYISYLLPKIDWTETDDFCEELLFMCNREDEALQALINPALKNWDASRVNTVDNVIIKMAICELLHFPSIPTKVSINEYIEITKTYSTPKSKEFVNGILDSVLNKLQKEDKIKKQGRGLIG